MQIDLSGIVPLGDIPMDPPPEHHVGECETHALERTAIAALQEAEWGGASEPAGDERGEQTHGLQIDLGGQLALPEQPRRKFVKNSLEHIAHARAASQLAKAKAKTATAVRDHKQTRGTLTAVCSLLPGASQLVGAGLVQHLGRKRDPRPDDFVLIVRALHLPTTSPIRLGVRLDRLQCAGARCILNRQQEGLEFVLRNLGRAMEEEPARTPSTHLTLVHMWDEVEAKFQWAPENLRFSRKAVMIPTMVQRGVVGITVREQAPLEGRTAGLQEHWLGPPLEVSGTSAGAVLPALRRFWPGSLDFSAVEAMRQLTANGTTVTYMPMGDKASGNLSVMKFWGQRWEDDYLTDAGLAGRVFYWPDTCTVHLHHRAKLQIHGLKEHTMRHFSVANLLRLRGVQSQVLARLEDLIMSKLQRIVSPPPQQDGIVDMYLIADILFKLDDPRHNRKGRGGKSQRHDDITRLCRMMNGNMLEDSLVHYCWNESTGQGCCADREEAVGKMVFACSCALFGEADPLPAESRWTNLLMNMQKTLLRRCAQGLGLDAFQYAPVSGAAAAMMEVDEAAMEKFYDLVNKSRLDKTRMYFAEPRTMHELVVYCVILDAADDNLLYSLMDDALHDSGERPSKMDLLLRPSSSKVGKCAQSLHNLLCEWGAGGARRRPWCLLDVVRAPLEQEQFLRWARSQVLRLTSALFRRYESKFASWPYKLYALVCDEFTEEERQQVVADLMGADRQMLDTYSFGVRAAFPTAEQLRSAKCMDMLANDFRNHAHSIAQIERLNAELTRGHNSRAPARNFAAAACHSVLRQAKAIHRARGGEEPLAPRALAKQPARERLMCSPLVLPLVGGAKLDGAEDPSKAIAGGASSSDLPGAQLAAEAGAALVPAQAESLLVAVGPHVEGSHALVVVERDNPSLFGGRRGLPQLEPQASKKGLNPYMLEKNKHMKAAKQALGRTMTPTEKSAAEEAFKDLWDAMDHDVFNEAYAEWRSSPAPDGAISEAIAYRPSWGGGCRATPVTKEELRKHIVEHKWPSDQYLQKRASEYKVAADEATDFERSSNYNVWGIGRWPRNINREQVDRLQFDICEKGLFNILEHRLGKRLADSGEVMLMISGSSTVVPGRKERSLCFVSGTCYSPKVWDATMVQFESEADAHVEEMVFPCWVRICTRECLVSKHFMVTDTRTSDEFIFGLTQHMSDMMAYLVNYEVVVREGSMLWSRIGSVEASVPPLPACLGTKGNSGAIGKACLVQLSFPSALDCGGPMCFLLQIPSVRSANSQTRWHLVGPTQASEHQTHIPADFGIWASVKNSGHVHMAPSFCGGFESWGQAGKMETKALGELWRPGSNKPLTFGEGAAGGGGRGRPQVRLFQSMVAGDPFATTTRSPTPTVGRGGGRRGCHCADHSVQQPSPPRAFRLRRRQAKLSASPRTKNQPRFGKTLPPPCVSSRLSQRDRKQSKFDCVWRL